MKSGNRMAWKMLICACLLVASGQGIITNAAGQYIVAVCAARNFTVGGFVTYFSFGAVSMIIAFPLVGSIMKRFALRKILVFCSIVWCAIYMLFSQFTQLWMFYVGNFICGFVCAIPAYVLGPVIAANWFEKKKGLATGIVMSSAGIFGAIFSVVIATMISKIGFQMTYILMGALSLIMMLTASSMIVLHPAMVGMLPYGADAQTYGKEQETHETEADLPGVPAKKAYRSAAFICVFFIVFILTCAGAFSTQIPVLAATKGFDPTTASIFSSVFMVGGLLGAYVWGFMNDKLKSKTTTIICLGVGAVSIVMAVFFGNGTILFSIGIFLLGLHSSGVSIQSPMMVSEIFGPRDYVAIFASIQMAMSLGGVIAGPMYGFIFDGMGTYDTILLVVAGILVVSALIVPFAYVASKKLMPANTVTNIK